MFLHRNYITVLALLIVSVSKGQNLTVLNIHLSGNTHTKSLVFYSEITIKAGSTYSPEELNREISTSRNNLLNTSLFNFVEIKTVTLNDHTCDILIEVQERWYLWPVPLISTADPNANLWWETKDLSRLNYGVILTHNNFRGYRETLSALVQFGYSKQFELSYRLPYLFHQKSSGMGFSAGYLQNYEIVTATRNNERIFYFDNSGNSRRISYLHTYLEKRVSPRHTHKLEAGLTNIQLSDSAYANSVNYLGKDMQNLLFTSLGYTFRCDRRDNIHYPLEGFFSKVTLVQYGLNFFENENLNVQNAIVETKYFYPIKEKIFWAGMLKGKITSHTNLPYFFQRGLGYEDFVRGYEYYILDGQAFALAKTNFKYQLIASKQKNLPLIENRKFKRYFYAVYINTFADAGFVKNRITANENNLSNQWLMGTGIGLDFVTYYDKVLRVEFAVNRLKEPGIYIHFTQPI